MKHNKSSYKLNLKILITSEENYDENLKILKELEIPKFEHIDSIKISFCSYGMQKLMKIFQNPFILSVGKLM